MALFERMCHLGQVWRFQKPISLLVTSLERLLADQNESTQVHSHALAPPSGTLTLEL